MSTEAVSTVLRADLGIVPACKLVLLGLAEHANPDGRDAFPSRERLAEYAGCGERSVPRYLRKLEDAGYIRVQQRARQHRPTVYELNLGVLRDRVPPAFQGWRSGTPESGEEPRGANGGSPGVPVVAPEPRTEPRTKDQRLRASIEAQPSGEGGLSAPSQESNPSVEVTTHATLMGAFVALLGRNPEGGEGASWGRVAKAMLAEGVTEEQVVARGAAYQRAWPDVELTPEALWKHWGRFGSNGSRNRTNAELMARLRRIAEGRPTAADLRAIADEREEMDERARSNQAREPAPRSLPAG